MSKEQSPMSAEQLEAKKKAAREKWSTEPKPMAQTSGGSMAPIEEIDAEEIEAMRQKSKEESSN
jgi:hypothetical protein